MNGLELFDIHKSFGRTHALTGVSFDVQEGEIVAVLGPSGCGKSTLLAVIAGLETPDQGRICWNGMDQARVPPHRRDFGLMFQDFALFPHMNAAKNVAFGLQMADFSTDQTQRRVQEVLDLVGLPEFSDRDVNTLSGGESQRVALARALAPQPRLLMLDEPLGSLDRTLRDRLLSDLNSILRKMSQTALYVTHDQEEAFALANRVVLMNDGRVIQVGTPKAIYANPSSTFVARFLGLTNLLPGQVIQKEDHLVVKTSICEIPLLADFDEQALTVLIRPDAVRLEGQGACRLRGMLVEQSFRGSLYRVVVSFNGVPLRFEVPATTQLPPDGEVIIVSFDPQEAVQFFNPEGKALPNPNLDLGS